MDLRRSGLLWAIVLCLVGDPGEASAGAPQIAAFDFVVSNEIMADCGDFLIVADGEGSVRLTTFFDRGGNPIRATFQGRYNGTMTNSMTGASVDDAPSVANITFDLVTGTQTNIGAFFTVTLPGEGAVLIEAGRIMFDGGGPPIFIAGPHRPPAEQIAILCNALS